MIMSKKFQIIINNKNLFIEISDWAEQANASVLVRYGDTVILATVTMSNIQRKVDYFPLTVEYEERFYAAGKILGSRFIRRESRPSDEAIITARLIDRAIRPLFPSHLLKEVQAIVTCLSWDKENDPDILGLIGVSQALCISDIPWSGPIGVVRIGRINENFILNPTYEEREKSDLDLVLAGIEKNNDIIINMIEAEAREVPEEIFLQAVQFAKPEIKKNIDFQNQITKQLGKEKISIVVSNDLELEKQIQQFLGNKLEQAIYQKNKKQQNEEIKKIKEEVFCFINEKYSDIDKTKYAESFFEKEINRIIQENVIKKERRPDERKLDELRKISCKVGLLPRTHGSGLFIRGQTKALSILTLGAPGDVKLIQGMEINSKKRFMHHYNFPPYSSGETKPMRGGPNRREIGHGMLVEKALFSLIPDFKQFPYTIRIVTEIVSSNGSTSMASVSSASLALMDAGVPIKNPAAGISIGIMGFNDEREEYKLLTDIQGPEDHYGGMDFKIAGTKNGITAIQMDVKIKGINEKIFKESLDLAKKARLQILDEMTKILPESRKRVSSFAPQILTLQIDPEKIKDVIGPGGRIINEIIKECEVLIDIEDTGDIFISAEKIEAAEKAVIWIKNITREIKEGEIFEGKIKRILNFGAFVELFPGQEGMIHISKLAPYRVKKVEDVVKIGDIVEVKVIQIDEHGRINLALKKVK